ncbi:DUF1471 domain-containing protein [Arsenophonus nasoniae]|uniref:DUF1471 domain-containing protein n=1 Tax=Arsenophonus nasoniae TaxID=638 RepID=A0AA95GL10_9GAMM|nr:DUF1471 domain-containing protein [Arsenophonus nasoniae]WGM00948.1 DUF1471 domain-containing protein [Arsenophonus nasoniae]
MRKIPAALILILGTLPFFAIGNQAEELIKFDPKPSIGTISVFAQTPTHALQLLSEKATQRGANGYYVTFLAYTRNQVQANARIYS